MSDEEMVRVAAVIEEQIPAFAYVEEETEDAYLVHLELEDGQGVSLESLFMVSRILNTERINLLDFDRATRFSSVTFNGSRVTIEVLK